jgi:hypothetical protein
LSSNGRQRIGVVLLVASVADSLLWLSGWFHPMAMRWRAAGGAYRATAIVLGSLTFKAVLLLTAAVLAFWPRRS